ncbi:hypothetical protein ACSQ67_022863 [Phaseolus vulgaris]
MNLIYLMFHYSSSYEHFPSPSENPRYVKRSYGRKMMAMRGRRDRFNGILVRFNKKAMLKSVLGSCFFIEPCQYHEPLLFTPLNNASSLCTLQLPFHSQTCIICRLCTLHHHLSLTLFSSFVS